MSSGSQEGCLPRKQNFVKQKKKKKDIDMSQNVDDLECELILPEVVT